MKLAICVIAYNRVNSLRRVLENLNSAIYDNDNVDLIISIDYSGIDDVKRVAEEYKWDFGRKRVIAYESNLGLRAHVLKCGDFTQEYDGLIVLEDDIYVSKSFYLYAKAAVAEYCNDERIAGISLYSFSSNYHNWLPFTPIRSDSDVYLMQNAQSWGQVWMKTQWQMFKEWYLDNNSDFTEMPHLPKSICGWKKSWLKYHTRYCIENNKYFVYPYIALTTCFSDVGEHTSEISTLVQVPILNGIKRSYKFDPTIKYDAFFENMDIPGALNMESQDVCVDLYGEKQNRLKCRYWLTLSRQRYKVVKTFALQLKPMDQNVIDDIDGNEIILYDTSVEESQKGRDLKTEFYRYIYNKRRNIREDLYILSTEIIKRIFR